MLLPETLAASASSSIESPIMARAARNCAAVIMLMNWNGFG
jgi:hypothetical protein